MIRPNRIYQRGDHLIVLQEDHRAYRVAKVERLSRHRGYIVRYWRWAEGRWSGETLAMFGHVVGPIPGGASRKDEIAGNLVAFANMRAAAIRDADQDMLAAVCAATGLEALPQPAAPPRSIRRKAA